MIIITCSTSLLACDKLNIMCSFNTMPAVYLLTRLCNNAFGVSGDSFYQASILQSYLTPVLITISKF